LALTTALPISLAGGRLFAHYSVRKTQHAIRDLTGTKHERVLAQCVRSTKSNYVSPRFFVFLSFQIVRRDRTKILISPKVIMKQCLLRFSVAGLALCAMCCPIRVAAGTVAWVGGSGDWTNTAHWNTGVLPGTNDNVVIGVGASITVTHSTGTHTVQSVQSQQAFVLSGGTLTVSNTFQASNTFTLSGGTLRDATVVATNGYSLVVQSGTLDGVTVNGVLDVASYSPANLTATNGLALNGTCYVGNPTNGNWGGIGFAGSQTLGGNGTVVLGDYTYGYFGYYNILRLVNAGTTLTIGPGITVRGQNGFIGSGSGLWWGGPANVAVLNLGTISCDVNGGTIYLTGQLFTDSGSMKVSSGTTLTLNSGVSISDPGFINSQLGGTLNLGGSLLGNTHNSSQYSPQGNLVFTSGTDSLEAMSQDLGNVAAGYVNNFAYNSISLQSGVTIKLVDQYTNSSDVTPECLYANSLIVPSGSTLNLNGLHVYTRLTQIGGTISGGTVSQVPDSGGPLTLNVNTPGSITNAGALDEFTFFGRGGQFVTVTVDTGSGNVLSPQINYAQVQLLDPSTNLLAQASNSVAGATVALISVQLPVDGTYQVRVHAPANQPASTGNFLVTVWNVTPNVLSLVLNQVANGQITTPYSVDQWDFAASANQQVSFDLVNLAAPGVAFDLKGPNSWNGFSNLVASSSLVTLPTSGNYTLTAHGTGGAYGIAYAFDLVSTPQTNLTVGSSFTGNFAGSGQAQLFQLNVPLNQPLLITLTSPIAGNSAAIYAKFGAPPTLGIFDYSSTVPGTANQTILTGSTYPGTWYILVYGNYIPTSANYTITVTSAPVIVANCNPASIGNSAPATITITGGGFAPNASVALINGANVYPASSVAVISASQIQAQFNLTIIPASTYSLQVTSATNTAAIPFTVTGGGAAALVTSLNVPNPIGYHIPSTLYVQYANTGQVAMTAPLLTVSATQVSPSFPTGRSAALLTLNASLQGLGYWTTAIPQGFANTVQFLASGKIPGLLQPGESEVVPIYYAGWQQPWDFNYDPIQFNLGILEVTNTTPVNWSSLEAQMQPASISNNVWAVLWTNFTNQPIATWGQYVQMLDNDSGYLYRLGENVSDVSALLTFEFAKANALNIIQNLASASDAYVPTPRLALRFSRVFPQKISQRYAQSALGYGWSHNWDYNLSVGSDGTVTVTGPGGFRRIFQPDSRGGYFDQAGDYGVLTSLGNGAFTLQEEHGLVTAFRADGKLNYMQDPNGNTVTATWSGNLLMSLTHSSGQSLQFTYTGNLIQTVTDPVGRTTTFSFDAAGHLPNAAHFDGSQIGYAYSIGNGATKEHALTQITYPSGTHQYSSYDQNGRVASIGRDGGAEAITFGYSGGNVSITDAYSNTTTLSLDNNGLLAKVVNAQTNTEQLAYDANYNLVSFTDPAGGLSAFTYDNMGNLVRYNDPLGNQTQLAYTGTFNQLAQLTDANGNRTAYAYDTKANLAAITYADNSVERLAYDAYGDPVTWTNRRGNAISYQFNSAGQLTAKNDPDGSKAIYNYDSRGNLILASNSVGAITMTYDGNDRLQRITYPGGQWLQFTYCICGRRESMTDQLGYQINYWYDSVGRLQSLTTTNSTLVQYTYDAAGRLSLKTLGNGVYSTYFYDSVSQLVALTNAGPGGNTISYFNYGYDSRGRRTSMNTAYGQWTYQYDDLGRLTSAVLASTSTNVPNQNLNYTYDALGNRVQAVENGVTTGFNVNNLNQYLQAGSTTLNYDTDGSLTQKVAGATILLAITNDFEDRVIGSGSTNGQRQIQYDALGFPEIVWRNGVQNIQIYDPFGLGNVAGIYNSSGTLIERQFDGFGTVATLDAATQTFLTFDAMGNVSDFTAANGSLNASQAFQPFGQQILGRNGTKPLLGFAGGLGVTEEGDLDFMRKRFYDPSLGRFSSTDPIGIAGGINVYAYARNNPVRYTDPYGLCDTPDNPNNSNNPNPNNGPAITDAANGFLQGNVDSWLGNEWTGVLGDFSSAMQAANQYIQQIVNFWNQGDNAWNNRGNPPGRGSPVVQE
jgi:RHS repeat-associated protein